MKPRSVWPNSWAVRPWCFCIESTEILDVLERHGIRECYFGHIHGSQAARRFLVGEHRGIRMRLISADHVAFMPVLVAKS